MSILKHPFLLSLSKLVEQERTIYKWIDLYTAQFIADSFTENNLEATPQKVTSAPQKPVLSTKPSNSMGDLFDDLPEQQAINKVDIIVLVLMCSQLVSQGKTHLNLADLSSELMASPKACGYRPSFRTTQELLAGLSRLEQTAILRVVTSNRVLADEAVPAEDESVFNQSPLILFQDRLYLAKYWMLHQTFEAWMQSRSHYVESLNNVLLTDLSEVLKKVFSIEDEKSEGDVNWQAVSAAHTLLTPFSLITGGPGTGKTTTAASLLFMLMYKRQCQRKAAMSNAGGSKQVNMSCHLMAEKLNVRLLAPTGKAAVKLADSIRYQLKQIESRILGNDLSVLRMSDCLPETGETVHRFLYEMGGLRDSFQRPKRFNSNEVLLKRSNSLSIEHADKQSPLDVVIVDESSMMDLALMVELVSLIPSRTQVILLGDHYQLPAVDPGQVFTECVHRFSKQKQRSEALIALSVLSGYETKQLTEFEEETSSESDLSFQPLCVLRKTFRFGGELKIAAEQIKAGQVHAFKKQFWHEGEHFKCPSAVTWFDLYSTEATNANSNINYSAMVKGYVEYFNLVAKGASLDVLVKQFECYQLLCSTLEGPLGVHFLNTYIEQRFHSACFPSGKIMGELYHGKTILVMRNHPHLGIYNGDIGFVIKDEKSGNLNVHFPVPNHQALVIPPARIKQWQTAYAMTVHKSQGSEYENVGVVLADYAKELLSRALLYTALTRSKECCEIWAGSETLGRAFEM